MNQSNRFFIIFLPLILVGLIYGVYELMILRFETGDVYPPYSSLRTDPLGTKAFYDGLKEMKGLTVTRNYGPASRIEHVKETTLMDLGDYTRDVLDVPVDAAPEVESYIIQGGRMVITLVGENTTVTGNWEGGKRHPRWITPTPSITMTPTVTATPSGSQTPGVATPVITPTPRPTLSPTATPLPGSTFGKQWGVDADAESLPKSKELILSQEKTIYQPVTVERGIAAPLPSKLSWHSAIYFKKLDPAWKALYNRGDHPVAIERKLGKGTLILLSDSYLVSNEAMLNDRHADLLSYLVGERRRVIFDETHLGIAEQETVGTLARKYGLGGFVLGLLVLALLFVWRNTMSLVPPPAEESAERLSKRSDKDASSGLVNLLRRNIPGRDILGVAFDYWKKSFVRERKHLGAKADEMEKELSSLRERRASAREGYLRLSKIYKRKK